MGLHMLCMNTNTNTFTYKARSDGESVSTVSWQTKYFLLSFCQLYSGTNLSLRFLRLECLVLIPSPPLPRLITTTQSPAAHSEETLSHPGLPHTDVIFPPPRPQTYRLQGFQVVLFQGLHVVLFQGFQDVLFLLLHGLQAAPPSAGLPIDLIGPAALQRLLISCLTYSSTYFPLIHCSL